MEEKDNILISSVKCKESDNKICIGYTQKCGENGEYTDVRTSQSDEKAAPEFYDAMKNLAAHAGNILGFTEEQTKSLMPYAASYKYDGDKAMSAIISCIYYTPSTKKTVINTPLFKCQKDKGDALKPGYFGEDAAKALWELELETRRYLDGKRAQTSLFDETEPNGDNSLNEKAA